MKGEEQSLLVIFFQNWLVYRSGKMDGFPLAARLFDQQSGRINAMRNCIAFHEGCFYAEGDRLVTASQPPCSTLCYEGRCGAFEQRRL